MRKSKNNTSDLVPVEEQKSQEVDVYKGSALDSVVDLGRHAVDATVAVTGIIGNTISSVADSMARSREAEAYAKIEIKRVSSDYELSKREEDNVHDEVMKSMDDVSKVVDHVVSTPELSKNPDVILGMLDAISVASRNSIEIRKTKKK